MLRLRLLQLSESARETLAVASVVGREFDVAVVEAALGRPVLDDLDEALDVGLVTTGDTPGAFRFVHALTRETAYGDLRPGRRAAWHAEVGDALRDRLAREPDLVTEVAHHYSRAASLRPEVVGRAVEHGRSAARAAERRGAFEEAAGLWTRAVDVERRAPEPDARRRHELLLGAASARQRLGDLRGAQTVLDEAVALARSVGDHRQMAEAATAFRSFGVWHWREMGTMDQTTLEVLLECLERVSRPRAAGAAVGQHEPGAVRRLRLAAGPTRRARARWSWPGAAATLRCCGPAWSRGASRCTCRGSTTSSRTCAREYLALGYPDEHEIAARFHLANALHRQGRAGEADAAMDRAFTVAARLRHSGCDVPMAWWRWLRATERGDPEANEIGQQALALHRRTSVVGLEELTGLTVLERPPASGPVPADVVATAENLPHRSYRTYVAHALARSGEHERALRLMGDPGPEHEYDYASHFAHCLRVEVLTITGRLDEVPAALERVEPYVDEMATYGSVISAGSTAYFIGIGAAALGDPARAERLLARAVEVNATAGSRRWEAQAQRALARVRGQALR